MAPHINLLININKRINKEDPWPPSTSSEEPSKPEYNRSFIFLQIKCFIFYIITSVIFTCTTLTTQNRDKGKEATIRKREPIVRISEQILGPSSQAEKSL